MNELARHARQMAACGYVLLFIALSVSVPVAAGEHSKHAAPSVIVTGVGSMAGEPDVMNLQVGVSTTALSAAGALEQNSQTMRQVQEALSAYGVAERAVQSARFDVNPEYDRSNNSREPKLVGYRVTHILSVRTENVAKAGALLDALLGAGANVLNSIQFDVADPEPLLEQARELAVADAIAKATTLASAAGRKLGEVRRISEGGVAAPRPMMAEMRASAAAPIAAGERSYSVTVTMVFALD